MRTASAILGGNHLPDNFWQISTFEEFLTRLENVKPGINVVPLVGHGTIRIAVIGFENRSPSETEMEEMKRLTDESLQAGAFGLSTGLIYVPANYAETEEIIELAKVAARYKGIYATHMRSEGDYEMEAIDETLKIGREAGMAAHIAHHKIAGKQNWGNSKLTLKKLAEARAQGQIVTWDQYPYRAASTILAAALPPHAQAQGAEVFAKKLKEPSVRQAIINEIEDGGVGSWENFIKGAGFENIIISVAPRNEKYIGQSIADIAATEAKDPYDVFFDLLTEEKMEVAMILFMMDEEDVIRILKDPHTMIGTDGIPSFGSSKVHPRMTGTFPRILGRYVRDKKVIALEEAVRKMTSLPAQTFRLYKKGVLRPGMDADVVIFDSDKIIDKSTFEDPSQSPEGIAWIIVNGEIAVDHGEVRGTSSGQVLRWK